jgi:hypothetical protein
MFTSRLFIKSLKYVETTLKPDQTYILSAKHGLLKLNEIITPYNKTLNELGSLDKFMRSQKIIKQLGQR